MIHARQDYYRIQDPANLIPVGEPVFLLRGQDLLAIMAVEFYGLLAAQAGKDDIAKLCKEHVALMRSWPVKKMPDLRPLLPYFPGGCIR
jgi:hypothetical protein